LTFIGAGILYLLVFRDFMLSHAESPWLIDALFWLVLLPALAYVFFKHRRRRGAPAMVGLLGGFIGCFIAGHVEFLYSEGPGGLEKLQAVGGPWELGLGLLIRPLLMFGWVLGFIYGLALETTPSQHEARRRSTR
jgi:hypothetical protein